MTIQKGFLDLLRSINPESAPSIRKAFFKGLEMDNCRISGNVLASVEATYKKFSEHAGLGNKPEKLSWHRFYYREVEKRKENIKRMREFEPVPDAVMDIANEDTPLTPRERESIVEYFEARDTITIWRVLAQAINQDILELDPAKCFLDLQKMIDLAREFLNWCRDPNIQSALSEITYLDLRDHHLHTLPPQIITLKRLRRFNLNNNNLEVLPPEIRELKRLKWVDLGNNNLEVLPTEIRELKSLKRLDLSNNKFKVLPTEIRELKRLKWVDLSNNKLKVLPDEIGELVDLRILILSHNRLNSLPDTMTRLVNLKELSLLFNEKLRIPECIYSLPGLQSIKISTGLEKECVVLRRMRLLNR